MKLFEKLAPYLPYGLKLQTNTKEGVVIKEIDGIYKQYNDGSFIYYWEEKYGTIQASANAKVILKPLSDLLESDLPYLIDDHSTDYFADTDNYIKVMEYIDRNIFHHYTEFLPYGLINWLMKNHYDVFGMIEAGEAIDINTLDK